MDRRNALGALGLTAAGLAAIGGAVARDDKKDHGDHRDKTAQACADCMKQCAKGLKHCARQLAAGKKEYLKCLELCADCMEMAAAGGKCCFGPSAKTACDACAKVCDDCAAECDKIPGDAELKVVAKACRDCAAACRELSKHAGHEPAKP